MIEEEWRPIVGREGLFEVSNLGRVRRLYAEGRDGWRILTLSRQGHNGAYRVVNLTRLGDRAIGRRVQAGDKRNCAGVQNKVHRLVLEAFVGPCPPGMEGCHRDNVGHHNWLGNLYWGTKADQAADMARSPARKGERNGRAKLTLAQVQEIRARARRGNHVHLAAEFGISGAAVGYIVRGDTWKTPTP